MADNCLSNLLSVATLISSFNDKQHIYYLYTEEQRYGFVILNNVTKYLEDNFIFVNDVTFQDYKNRSAIFYVIKTNLNENSKTIIDNFRKYKETNINTYTNIYLISDIPTSEYLTHNTTVISFYKTFNETI
jgi:hypothetical protein